MERDSALLFDILDSSRLITEWTRGMNAEQFLADRRTHEAVLHRLIIIGEAAGKLSSELRDRHLAVPWAQMIGMRHRIVHGYQDVDMELVWRTVVSDVPKLARNVGDVSADGS